MRISDWSSDVCSSDLLGSVDLHNRVVDAAAGEGRQQMLDGADAVAGRVGQGGAHRRIDHMAPGRGDLEPAEIDTAENDAAAGGGRPEGEERQGGVVGKDVTVSVGRGGRLHIKTQKDIE